MAISKSKAVRLIEKNGILLVYPLQNKKEPKSLWSELFPRTKMRWEWDENGDQKVSDLWHLRAVLSISREVVYAKWYQGRATFFSREVFVQMLAYLHQVEAMPASSREILEVLEIDSPLSTKQLKEAVGLQGRLLESTYEKALRVLWRKLWVVAFGEVEDSSFPSLAVGATSTLFEDLWLESKSISASSAEASLRKKLGAENPFFLFAQKLKKAATAKA